MHAHTWLQVIAVSVIMLYPDVVGQASVLATLAKP